MLDIEIPFTKCGHISPWRRKKELTCPKLCGGLRKKFATEFHFICNFGKDRSELLLTARGKYVSDTLYQVVQTLQSNVLMKI